MGSMKVAVMIVLGHAPTAPLRGAAEITVGGVVPGMEPAFLSGSLHPTLNVSSRNAANQIVCWLYRCMTFTLISSRRHYCYECVPLLGTYGRRGVNAMVWRTTNGRSFPFWDRRPGRTKSIAVRRDGIISRND